MYTAQTLLIRDQYTRHYDAAEGRDVKKEYAFEMTTASVRYGHGVTEEVGMDLANAGVKKLCVITDKNVVSLPGTKTVLDSLHRSRINFEVYSDVRVEPTDKSFKEAIEFAKRGQFDLYLAFGGGSVIDTCKAANLYASKPEADFLDFVNTPIGKGEAIMHRLKPLVAIPTTAGTGSETTGVAIFDFEDLRAKTGISGRALRPTLGLVDPLHAASMPARVAANCGFDTLCHAVEAYTALPYNERMPRPANPKDRPAYQGRNPFSDVWAKETLRIVSRYFRRAVLHPDDTEARSAMHFAAAMAGMSLGNAGVHLCHGMSYAVAGSVKSYRCADYSADHPIIPHGLSVVLTAPAVFNFTHVMCPERHLEAAELLGADVASVNRDDAGRVLSDTVRRYMSDLSIDNGLKAVGYSTEDIPALVKATLPQERVTKLSPRPHTEEDLASLLEQSMTVY